MSKVSLPDYERPPVVEVVFGVVLSKLEKLLTPHLGIVWDAYRAEFPKCTEMAPLLSPETTDLPTMPRVWFLDETENQIIQVQRDRFIFNWRKHPTSQEYPRYCTMRATFDRLLETFVTVLQRHDLGKVVPVQCELTYVNHIPRGEGWSSLGNLDGLFPSFGYREVQPRREADQHELIQMDLIARSPRQEIPIERVLPWLDSASECIVTTFSQLTSESVQSSNWGRRNDARH
ncbi:MAG: TIGR04255 family protein [Candidatus Hydrogenedentes bacterium]|nr:TIGR04255 family protein [Candidatus Hydrogenedentota bacterium]